ncbi:uncharacterized protein LOC131619483 [Vicia villosa]|uniref:uncharacterized protein LOC131619483 n=1 Tax=Vicia villosa TaxID=3911 RepID=UPI00273AF812|nr:uncharacterized protein LOC131619483 [Vicia villosa]
MENSFWPSESEEVELQMGHIPFGGSNRNHQSSGVEITSFYVSEFPDYSSAKDLFELFCCVGKAVEVSISPRRNSRGKRFGFACFPGIEDGRLFAVRLDNIIITGRQIHANLPRFQRGKLVGDSGFVNQSIGGGGSKVGKEAAEGNFRDGMGSRRGIRTFAAAVGGVSGCKDVTGEVSINFCFKSNDEDKKRFLKAYVGRVLIPRSAYNIQSYMEMDGVYPVRVIPLGGDVCLSKDRESRFIEDLIVEGETWWKSWFSEIKRWEEGTVGESRDVWLRIFGIPAHVWMSYFFVALAEVWLKFICVDERTAKGEAFDVARIMVKVNLYLKILDVFPVTIDGKMFNLVMREDAIGLFGSNVEPSGNRDSASSSADSERIWQDFSLKGSLNHGVDVPFRDHGEIDKGDSSGGGGGGSENFKGSFSIPVLLGREENSATAWKDAKLGSFDEAVSRFRAETSLNFDSNKLVEEVVIIGNKIN